MSSEVWLNGLPPVGCECNVMARPFCSDDGIDIVDDGMLIKVKYVDKNTVVGEFEDGRSYGFMVLAYNFRPLKTKEQTEREEAINNVCNDLGIMLGTSHDRIDAAIDSMLKLGYHSGPKVNELSDEEIEVFLKGRASLLSPPYKIEAAKWAIDYILDKEE